MTDRLSRLLSAMSRESNLSVGWTGPAFNDLRRALVDTELQHDARSVIEAGKAVASRDHITRWRIDALTRALEA